MDTAGEVFAADRHAVDLAADDAVAVHGETEHESLVVDVGLGVADGSAFDFHYTVILFVVFGG